jgi:hypothetical protein
MTTVTPLSLEEIPSILLRWEKDGLTDEEKDEFLTASLQLLTDKAAVQGFGDNIAQVAQLAADIDKTFTDVETILWAVVYFAWPIGIPLMRQWVSFKEVGRNRIEHTEPCPLAHLIAMEGLFAPLGWGG